VKTAIERSKEALLDAIQRSDAAKNSLKKWISLKNYGLLSEF
jgi:hypothetical protein